MGYDHDLYVQSDALFFTDVFGTLRNKWIEIYELDPAHFIICTCISMARFVEKDKLELLTDNDLLMMVETKLEIEYAM